MKVGKFKNIVQEFNLTQFAIFSSNGRWEVKPHLLMINLKINEILKSESKKLLIVNMPPRHGKSELISKYFPAWYLLNNPQKRVIFTTYSDRFAEHFGRSAQDLYLTMMPFYDVGIYQRKQSSIEWITDKGGGMVSTGAGGSLTGRGADLILIDDPIKNVQEALSPTHQENLVDWLYSTALTRLEPNGKVILIMTRWQPEDLTGVLLEKFDSEKLEVLKLTAIAEKDEWFRKEGEALWPERYNTEELINIKQQISLYWFNAMYQQDPVIRGGEYVNINNFKDYLDDGIFFINVETELQIRKTDSIKYGAVDLAISTAKNSDFTVIGIFYVDIFNNIFIEEIIRLKIKPDQHEEVIEKYYRDYRIQAIGIEKVAYQEVIIHRLASKGLNVVPLIPEAKKVVRVQSILGMLREGKVYIKKDANWRREFLKELEEFPKSAHDDQVDVFAYMANFLGMGNIGTAGRRRIKNTRYEGQEI